MAVLCDSTGLLFPLYEPLLLKYLNAPDTGKVSIVEGAENHDGDE